MAFLVVFALIAIPASVQETWIGVSPRELFSFVLLDDLRSLSEELLLVCCLLGGIVGLYFAGLGITDKSYRAEGFDQEVAGVRKIMAVRTLYKRAVATSGPDRLPDRVV